MTDQSTNGNWALASGNWSSQQNGTAFRLHLTQMGFAVAPAVTQADLIGMMHMRSAIDGAGPAYPPEFDYSPHDGTPLPAISGHEQLWIAPSGARSVNAPLSALATGLNQTALAIDGALLQRRGADLDPELEMPLPPPGAYEFFCAPFGTLANVLLAIDTGKGALFAWLPASATWQPMTGDAALLAESSLSHRAWRAELMVQLNSCLFLPTDHGLALVMPDFPSLKYCVAYIGEGLVPAAPIAFEGKVWAPNVDRYGFIQVISVDTDGVAGAPLVIDGVRELGEVSRPVAYGRMAIWPCTNGQLRLQVGGDGNVLASFIPWAPDLTPRFEFGCPYLSRSGVLWQLCFSTSVDMFTYVRLGQAAPEQVEALTPRMCSGSVNYRFRSRQAGDPWLEPEHGDDGAANTVVYPMLELGGGAILALRMGSASGLTELLNSHERVRAELVYEDHSRELTIHAIAVPRPWETRLFFYRGALWAYHPAMQRMIGWQVAA